MRRLLIVASLAAALAACSGKNSSSSSGSTGTSGTGSSGSTGQGTTGASTGGTTGTSGTSGAQYVIEIDIDDHGLKALWDARAPNLKRMISEGTLAYTRVDLPTHSNHNNVTLVTGEWPEATNVPANSWLTRTDHSNPTWQAWSQPFNLVGLGLGEYVYYNLNPLNDTASGPAHHVDSVYSTVENAGLGPTTYVGQLPPFEMGASDVHFTVKGSSIFGLQVSQSTAENLLVGAFNYPRSAVSDGGNITFDGPPTANFYPADGGTESIEHFTIRDAANVWQAAAAGSTPPPRFMMVWAFIALDGDPTSTFGADTAELDAIVDDYDDAIGDLLTAIQNSPYANQVNILFTLDHGKVDSTKQVRLGNSGNDGDQLAQQVTNHGAPEVTPLQYDMLNEDGDALIYAKVPDAGNAFGYPKQTSVAHKLVDLIQSGNIQGVDTTRTLTWDGYAGTHTLHDFRIEGPNQADIIVFPQDGWTLGTVVNDGGVGTFDVNQHPFPFGRHGGLSYDELYVPLIMWGPAFKQGVVLKHPVNHADVAPTAMKILGQDISSAQGGPILAAFKGDTAETLTDPGDMSTARDTVLTFSGFQGATSLAGTPANQVVIVDLAGVSYDEAFTDPVTSAHMPMLAALAASGVSFEAAWNRYRASAENRFQMLAGGTPVLDPSGNWLATAETDPAQTGFPGRGLLLEPAPTGQVPNSDALTAWRGSDAFVSDSLIQSAQTLGFTPAVIGNASAAASHLSIDPSVVFPTSDAQAAGQLGTFIGANNKAVAVVSLGQTGRTADRHSAAALAELDALDAALDAVHTAAPNATFIVTSSNGADIDDSAAAFYGPQAARHVPFVIAGGPARSGVISGQPVTAADVPATALFALGQPASTDLVWGTYITGTTNAAGIPVPVPSTSTEGHVLATGFTLH